MIQKLETGYLQLLRVVFLAAASIAIVIAIFSGVNYMLRHNAEPAVIKDEVKVTLANYTAPSSSATSEENEKTVSDIEVKDPLLEKFSTNLSNLGKKTDPDFSLNKDAVLNVYNNYKEDAALGTAFIEQLNGVLEAALAKPDVIARLRADFGAEINRIMEFAKGEFKLQTEKIEEKRQQAEIEAAQKRVSAQGSLYTAGILFLVFVGLILLIVLLKIERNLRGAELQKAAPVI